MDVVTYYRVSTAGQGQSGLGLAAQREAVRSFCSQRSCEVLAEYVEIESGGKNDRPELEKAMHRAEVTGATLVVSKMDRLSRNVAFLAALQDSGAKFVAADMPEANELTIHILAAVAQAERKAISTRTKEALAAAKARGTWKKADKTPYKSGNRLGNPNGAAALRKAGKGNRAALEAIKGRADRYAAKVAREVTELRQDGSRSLRELAAGLNSRSIKTPRGGKWHAASVRNLLTRLDRLEACK